MIFIHKLQVHLVFVVKYRRRLLTQRNIRILRNIFEEICVENEADLIECNGETDHIRILISYPPKLSIAILVAKLKGKSSYVLRNKYNVGNNTQSHLWTPSYFVTSCGGAPLEIIKRYIKNQ